MSKVNISTSNVDIGIVKEILIEFEIKDASCQRDIFHSHFILVVTCKNKNYHPRIQELKECDDVVLNRIFVSDNKTELCWNEDVSWQDAVTESILDEWEGSSLTFDRNLVMSEVIGRIQAILDGVTSTLISG